MLPGHQGRCLFLLPHKAFRGMFFELVSTTSATDFRDLEAVKALKASVEQTNETYLHHNHTENTYILPHVERYAPALAAKWKGAHDEAPGHDQRLVTLLEDILETPDVATRRYKGLLFYKAITSDLQDHLAHMHFEETEISPVISQNLSTAQQEEIEATVMKNIPPEAMQSMLPLFLRYHDNEVRGFMLTDLKIKVPPFVWTGMCGLFKQYIPAADLASLQKEFKLEMA